MKKSVFLLTATLVLLVIWACSESDYDFTHANPFDPDHVAPDALTKLEVTVEKIDRIKMVWDDDYFSTDSNYTFIIDKKIGDGDWQEKYKIFTRKTTTFTDSSAGIDKINYYRARVAYDQNISTHIETSIFSPFNPPNNINLNRKDINTIQMSWSDNSNGEDGFKVDRYSSGAWHNAYATLSPNVTAWTDSSAALNDTIRYRIYGYRKTTVSDSILTSTIINTIPAPTNLTIRQNDISEFELNWTDNAVGEQGFIIHRSIDGIAYSALDTLAANNTNYIDPTVGKGKNLTDVSYRVYSYYNTFKSDYAETEAPIAFPAPSNITYEKLSISSIKINWTDNSISEDGFKIDRSVGGVWTLNYASTSMNTATFTDNNALINQTILYRIYAYKGINTTTSVTSAAITNTFPAPSSLTYSKLSITSIKLDWIDNSTGEDGFRIDRSVGGTWTNAYATVGGNIKTYTDANVPINQTVLYRVYAYKSTNVSTSITTSSISNIIPAPTNPVISQIAVNTVRLDWTDNSIGEDGFKIDKKNDTGIWTTSFATVGANAITWLDTTAVISDSLQYRIYGYKGATNSAYAYTSAADLTFPPPTNIIEIKINLTSIKLDWTDNSIGETGFKIDRQIDGGTWSIVYGTVSADIVTWTDANAPVNKNIQYRIYGYTASDNSSYGYSNLIANTFPVPTLNTVTQQSVSSFKLDWSDNSNGEDGFKIDRKIDDGAYAQIASVSANTVTYTDSSINKKGYSTVYYRIKAYKATDESVYSEKTQTIAFPAPSNINYSKVSVNSININWTDNSTGEDGFKIDKKVGALAWVTGYGTVTANATAWLDANAEPNTTIQYKVYAYKGLNTSLGTLSVEIDNTFHAPTGISSQKLTLTSIKLNWTDNSIGETGFIIDRKVGVDSWAAYDSTSANSVTWTDANAVINSTLQYRIKAYKDIYASTTLETTAIDNAIPVPTNLSANVSGMKITLNWTDNSTGEDGFKIDRMVGDGVWEDNYASLGSNIITWNETVTDTGKYYYRVKVFKSTFSSNPSIVASAGAYQMDNPMILVPAGTFQMGQVGVAEPVHEVTLTHSFYMAKYETTQKEWSDIMGTNPSSGYGVGDNYPVYNVSWYDILVYCNKRSIAEGLNPCFVINDSTDPNIWGAVPTIQDSTWDAAECRWYENGYRLPTEAEWEYAARYNDGRIYPWGNITPDTSYCNYVYSDLTSSTPVGTYSKGESKLKISDLSGNLYEHVWDGYGEYTSNNQLDPIGINSCSDKVIKGGSWGHGISYLSTSFRHYYFSYEGSVQHGFRVARNNPADPRPVTFINTFGGTTTDSDVGFSVSQASDGGYVFAGYTASFGAGSSDAWLVKTDLKGIKQWEKAFGGLDSDDAKSIIQTTDGGYILGGLSRSFNDGNSDFYLIKTNSSGDSLWTRLFDGVGDHDTAYEIIQTYDNGYAIVGTITLTDPVVSQDVWLIKTDSNGNYLWDKKYGGPSWEEGYSIRQTADGGYIIIGSTQSYGAGGMDCWLIKTDSSGNKEWDKTFGGTQKEETPSVQITNDGGYIIAGYTQSFGEGVFDAWLIKTDSSGNKQWDKTFGGLDQDEGSSVVQTVDNGYLLVGLTRTYSVGETDIWLIKTDSSGNKQWDKTFGDAYDQYGENVKKTTDGGYIITGSWDKPDRDACLIKTDENGNVMGGK